MRSRLGSILEFATRRFRGWGLTRFRFFYRAKQWYKSLLQESQATYMNVNGYLLYLDPLDSLRLLSHQGVHEPQTTAFFKEIIQPGDSILDVGAHIGYFTLLFAELTGSTGKVYAFEPNPESYRYLEKNIAANQYTNIETVPKIVSDRNGPEKLFLSEATSSLVNSAQFDGIMVESITLDSFFGDQKIDLVKIDAEGTDMQVLHGMKKLLHRNPGIRIVIECNPDLLHMAGSSVEEFFEFLWNLGLVTRGLGKTRKVLDREHFPDDFQAYIDDERVENIFCEFPRPR